MAGPTARGARSPRNIETRKKKARRAIPRKPVTTSLGNTLGALTYDKKLDDEDDDENYRTRNDVALCGHVSQGFHD